MLKQLKMFGNKPFNCRPTIIIFSKAPPQRGRPRQIYQGGAVMKSNTKKYTLEKKFISFHYAKVIVNFKFLNPH